MPKVEYVEMNIGPAKLAVISQANAIIEEYAAQGFDLTLRQLYYQFVSRDLIPNRQSEYKRLGDIVNDGRLAGLIDWDTIVDRTRNLEALPHWSGPDDIVASSAQQFRVDKWSDQPTRIEVWIEKDALLGVISGVCEANDVAYFSCRGYTSQSEMWSASQRLEKYLDDDQTVLILHFGDHDPSGIDMTRDITDRLELFFRGDDYDLEKLEVRRMALTTEQIAQYNPPPNPAKVTDSRYEGYERLYGNESWELDALEPQVLAALIQSEIDEERDAGLWEARLAQEVKAKDGLNAVAARWSEVQEYLGEEEPDDE
jgi:hypothetical protein